MKIYYECVPCFVNQAIRALPKVEEELREPILRDVLKALSTINFELSPPEMAREIFDIIEKHTGDKDLYAEIKATSNKYILNLEKELRDLIANSADSFLTGLHLAIAGNIIDFGAKHDFSDELIHKEIDEALKVKLNEADVEHLRQAINHAENILYLGDNAGEIVFDKLFIEQLPRDKITFAVRGRHIINDALLEDARSVGIDKVVSVISNGSGMPGTVLQNCSEEFKKLFNNADLIISKGQGNYETLNKSEKNIVFLLKIKCLVVARDLDCEIGQFMLKTCNKNKAVES